MSGDVQALLVDRSTDRRNGVEGLSKLLSKRNEDALSGKH